MLVMEILDKRGFLILSLVVLLVVISLSVSGAPGGEARVEEGPEFTYSEEIDRELCNGNLDVINPNTGKSFREEYKNYWDYKKEKYEKSVESIKEIGDYINRKYNSEIQRIENEDNGEGYRKDGTYFNKVSSYNIPKSQEEIGCEPEWGGVVESYIVKPEEKDFFTEGKSSEFWRYNDYLYIKLINNSFIYKKIIPDSFCYQLNSEKGPLKCPDDPTNKKKYCPYPVIDSNTLRIPHIEEWGIERDIIKLKEIYSNYHPFPNSELQVYPKCKSYQKFYSAMEKDKEKFREENEEFISKLDKDIEEIRNILDKKVNPYYIHTQRCTCSSSPPIDTYSPTPKYDENGTEINETKVGSILAPEFSIMGVIAVIILSLLGFFVVKRRF